MNLAERDGALMRIHNQISAKRKFLLDKQKELEKESNYNQFLKTIYNDYKRYHEYIIKEKEEQIAAMESLKDYIKDIIKTNRLTEEQIANAKREQEYILKEMDNIRGDLEIIVKETQS
jgi:SMC interacting uncharacterized protein involved in chromosome segregation